MSTIRSHRAIKNLGHQHAAANVVRALEHAEADLVSIGHVAKRTARQRPTETLQPESNA